MFVKVQIEDCNTEKEAVLLENDPKVEKKTGVQVEDTLLKQTRQGFAQLLVSNWSGFTCFNERGFVLGEAVKATVIPSDDDSFKEGVTEAVMHDVRMNVQEKEPIDS